MERSIATTAVTGALVAVLFVAVAAGGEVELAQRPPSLPWSFELEPVDLRDPPAIPEAAVDGDPRQPTAVERVIAAVLQVALVAALAWLTVRAGRYLWRNRPRLVWRRALPPDDFEVMDDIAARIIDDADEQLAALRLGEARNAIVECWLRLELLVGSAGFERDPADTAAEFTARVLGSYRVDADAILDLSSLYREARFSNHEIGERERSAAVDALEAIHLSLWHDLDGVATA